MLGRVGIRQRLPRPFSASCPNAAQQSHAPSYLESVHEEEDVMVILFDAIAAVAAWASIALMVWGAVICVGELLASEDQDLGKVVTRPQALLFQ